MIFFFLYVKIPQFTALFWFTQNQAEVVLAFFIFGSLIGAQNLSLVAISYTQSRYRLIQITLFSFYIIGIICLEFTATLGMVYHLCIYSFLIGITLSTLISQELYLISKDSEPSVMVLSVFCFGVYGSLMTFVADRTHYMNRDDPTWSYINIALAGVFAFVALFFTIEGVKTCKCCACCGCCCKCCKQEE